MLERFFGLRALGTNPRQEILAGITTYLTMAYIIVVNPSVLGETGMDRGALVIVTCIVAGVSTLLMGIVAKVPIAMAPGMGLNAFFAYTIVIGNGVPWQTALGMVFWAGVLFLILSLFGVRQKIVEAIPKSLISAISVGIGLFILFIGTRNLGLIVAHPAKLVTLGSYSPELAIGVAGLILTIPLFIRKAKAAIFIGIAFSTALAAVFGLIGLPETIFETNFDLSPVAFQLDPWSALDLGFIATIFVLFYIDFFDTIGTLMACCGEAGLVDKNGKVKGIGKMLNVDASATMLSGIFGTSPTTSYIESGAGIAAGGKSGLTASTTAILFFVSILLAPILVIVPSYAAAPALIMVGFIMIRNVNKIEFNNLEESIPAMVTFICMPLMYSISTGLAFGFISWVMIKLVLGKFSEVHWIMYLIAFLSVGGLVL